MRRREFIGLIGIIGVVWPPVAQPADELKKKMRRIGFLASVPHERIDAFDRELREQGYSDGENIIIVRRFWKNDPEQLAKFAAELVALDVEVIVAPTTPEALAAKALTNAIPIVTATADAVGVGLAESFARPGGNVTGMSDNAIDLSAKRLELLKEAVPTVSRIAVLWNERDSAMTQRYREIDRAAQALGVSIQPLGVREPDDFERAFSAMNRERPDAMIMVTDVLTNLNRKRVLDYAEAHRIPAMYEFASFVREDGLMSYGPSDDYLFGRAAVYVDKILKGAKPSELPAEEPTVYHLVINSRTAKKLGFNIPQSLLLRGAELVQ